MSTKLEDVMGARCHELVTHLPPACNHSSASPRSGFDNWRCPQTGLAKSHFEKLNAIMAQQREALGEVLSFTNFSSSDIAE